MLQLSRIFSPGAALGVLDALGNLVCVLRERERERESLYCTGDRSSARARDGTSYQPLGHATTRRHGTLRPRICPHARGRLTEVMRYTPTCMHNECNIHVRFDNTRNACQPCGPSPEAGCTTRASDGSSHTTLSAWGWYSFCDVLVWFLRHGILRIYDASNAHSCAFSRCVQIAFSRIQPHA